MANFCEGMNISVLLFFLGYLRAAIFREAIHRTTIHGEVKSPMCDVGQAATRTFLHVTVIWTRTPVRVYAPFLAVL